MSKDFDASKYSHEQATATAAKVREAVGHLNSVLAIANAAGVNVYAAINAGDKEDIRSTSGPLHSIKVAAIKSALEF